MQDIGAHRSLREKQRQEREELIIQAAKEVLLEKGYYETSMDEIAARVGIAKGTLYLHFARKEDLVLALIENEMRSSLLAVEQVRSMEINAQEKLRLILHSMYQKLWNRQTSLITFLHTSTDLKAVLKEKHGTIFHQIREHILALLKEGQSSGQFDTLIPAEVLLNIFFCMCSPRAFQTLVVEQQMPIEEFISYIERAFFKGIAADSAI